MRSDEMGNGQWQIVTGDDATHTWQGQGRDEMPFSFRSRDNRAQEVGLLRKGAFDLCCDGRAKCYCLAISKRFSACRML